MEAVMKKILVLALVMAGGALAAPRAQEVLAVDPDLPGYQKVSGISGSLSSVGSDSMNNMMTLWAETFRTYYPNVKIQVEGKGSSTAPPALIAGTAQLGPMSRVMRSTEIDQFEQRHGYRPLLLRTSYDALAIYVNKDNPIQQLSLAQVDAIFGKSRKRGFKENITTWGQLGADGRLGGSAHQSLRPQLGERHLRLRQRVRAEERRLQGHREGAAGLGVGRAGCHRRSFRHRIQRHRLQDLRSASGGAGHQSGGTVLPRHL
jgi:hypothetical protein